MNDKLMYIMIYKIPLSVGLDRLCNSLEPDPFKSGMMIPVMTARNIYKT